MTHPLRVCRIDGIVLMRWHLRSSKPATSSAPVSPAGCDMPCEQKNIVDLNPCSTSVRARIDIFRHHQRDRCRPSRNMPSHRGPCDYLSHIPHFRSVPHLPTAPPRCCDWIFAASSIMLDSRDDDILVIVHLVIRDNPPEPPQISIMNANCGRFLFRALIYRDICCSPHLLPPPHLRSNKKGCFSV